MSFTTVPQWTNEGVAPSETLKTNGFTAGYKPPATVFNYMFNRYGICIDELQTEVDKKTGKSLTGQIVSPTKNTKVTAGTGTEIYNDYRPRKFGSSSYNGVYAIEGNIASGDYSHAEGEATTASGICSHSEGRETLASGDCSHVEGENTVASGDYSHAEGTSTTASGYCSHSEGTSTTASGICSHSEGYLTTASGDYSHAEGTSTTASGYCSHSDGCNTIANNYQFVTGKFNVSKTGASSDTDVTDTNSLFIVGCGTSDTARANALRITAAGKCYGKSSFGSSGADYAEKFEWLDGNSNNEDRRGLFVTLDGDKIRLANADDDYILGVISATPSVVGDVQSEVWKDMYLKDVFGCPLTEIVTVPETTDDTGRVIPEHTETRYKINPDYDPTKEYKNRDERKEWATVGLMGKLIVVDDGTCEVNKYCKVTNGGVATNSNEKTNFRVMARVDNTHVSVFIK